MMVQPNGGLGGGSTAMAETNRMSAELVTADINSTQSSLVQLAGGSGNADTPVVIDVQSSIQRPQKENSIASAGTVDRHVIPTEDDKMNVSLLMKPGFTDETDQEHILAAAKKMLGDFDVTVTLQEVTVVGDCEVSQTEYATVGNTFISMCTNLFFGAPRPKARVLLNEVTTAFAPGKITLLIGPPQSGKSSLLKYISDRLDPALNASTEGRLRFNGIELPKNLIPRVCAYVPQIDQHTPVLTVEETLNFSFDVQSLKFANRKYKEFGFQNTKESGRPKVEVLLHNFGLKNCKDTIVGDGTLRGVSGGEKKRVTSAELIAGTQIVTCMDEISTGLDSAATYDIVKSQKMACHAMKTTCIISLLQPPPDVFELFDDVVVMGSGGNMVYHGPVSSVRSYLSDELGFHCPETTDFADFLVDICTDDASMYYKPESQFSVDPPTSKEMSARFRRSSLYYNYIRPRFSKAVQKGQSGSNKITQPPYTWEFGSTFLTMFMLNADRHFRILRRNTDLLSQRMKQCIGQAVMLGTIFWNTDNHALKLTLLFVIMTILSFGNLYIIDVASAKRAVFYKQRDANFYPTIVYTIGEFISELPLLLTETSIIVFLIFFFVGFANASFPLFYIGMFLTTCTFLTVFKAITAHMPDASASQGAAIGFMAVAMCFSGFLITESSIPDYFIWLYWIMPYGWILRALALNEFKCSDYDELVGPPGSQKRLGDVILESFALYTDEKWITYGFVYITCLFCFALFVYTAGLHYRRLGNTRPLVVVSKKKKTIKGKKDLKEARPNQSMQQMAIDPSEDVDLDVGDRPYTILDGLSVKPSPITVLLRNMEYTVQVPEESGKGTKDRKLLNGVNAAFLPGTMTALMGSSGAGKTTLMDVIAGRKTSGSIGGEILINGHPQDLSTFARISGYVEQTDIHIETMTVIEALRFSAYHRLPAALPDNEKDKVVEAIIDLIELRPILNKAIGGAVGSGLSVEQKKRVTIGVEMAANPSVLFLDEPTSGLDSRSARIVMRAVRRIAATGRTVICTIHQPSFEIFSMFDNLLLLKKGGWTVYNGTLGPAMPSPLTGEPFNTAGDLIAYFEGCGPDVKKHVPGKNPAEYMLETIGAGTSAGNATTGAQAGPDFVECYNNSDMAKGIQEILDTQQPGDKITFESEYAASHSRQMWLSVDRWLRCYWRNTGYNFTRIMIVFAVATLFSVAITQDPMSDIHDQPGLQTYNGAVFSGVFFTAAVQAVMTVTVIGDTKMVFYREQAAKMYSPAAFLFGITVAEIPWMAFLVGLHTCIFYPISHLYNDSEYVVHYCISMFFFSTMMCYWGQMLSAVLPTTEVASLACGASIGVMNLYSGFFMPESDIPYPWKILFFISPARFGLKAAMPKQFYCDLSCIAERTDGYSINCQDPSLSSLASGASPYDGKGPGCALMTDATGYVTLKKGEEWLMQNIVGISSPAPGFRVTIWDYWSITTESSASTVWTFTWSLFGFLLAFRLITLYCLTYVKHIKR